MRCFRDCASFLSRSTLLGSPPDSCIGYSAPSSSTRSIAPSSSAPSAAALPPSVLRGGILLTIPVGPGPPDCQPRLILEIRDDAPASEVGLAGLAPAA
eukprot:8555651-Pyramimonas_sp.AAC.1